MDLQAAVDVAALVDVVALADVVAERLQVAAGEEAGDEDHPFLSCSRTRLRSTHGLLADGDTNVVPFHDDPTRE
jgi:hypothetical protein